MPEARWVPAYNVLLSIPLLEQVALVADPFIQEHRFATPLERSVLQVVFTFLLPHRVLDVGLHVLLLKPLVLLAADGSFVLFVKEL
jgi:hypothetical protein